VSQTQSYQLWFQVVCFFARTSALPVSQTTSLLVGLLLALATTLPVTALR
jgi:hypothetical protein